ncbi:MAG TPA: hypothetical protein VLJ59_13170 [Mycobacteriales bacterium]|nr:hypothetical protein [Mycobacteriales bacterium]
MSAEGSRPGRGWHRLGELGPAWLSGIAAVVTALTSAGYVVGRATAPPSATPVVSSAPATTTPATPTAPSPTPTDTSPPSGASPAPGNGTQLASYDVSLAAGYGFDTKLTKPGQADIVNHGGTDLYFSGFFYTKDRIVMLPTNTTPTYPACQANTIFSYQTPTVVQGMTFCLVENGALAGVKVTDLGPARASTTVRVTIWQNS